MKRYTMGKRILSALAMTAALLSCVCVPSFGQTKAPDVIRVGIYEQEGFLALNARNELTGHGAVFMQSLAKYANVRFEYVRLSWSECMEQLLSGDIDIVTDARKSDEREQLYDFSTENIGQIQAALFVPKDAEDIYYNDIEKIKNLRVGFEKGALNRELYEAFARDNGFTADIVEYATDADMRQALFAGEIDAFGNDVHLFTNDLKVVSLYNTEPNYIMAAKGSAALKRLNTAMQVMYAEKPDLVAEQFAGITGHQMYEDILLTREQAAYIKENPVIRVAVPKDRKPASWYDAETGMYRGIAIDIMSELSAKTGFEFEYTAVEPDKAAVQMLEDDSIDIVIPAIPAELQGGDYQTTEPLYTLSLALAAKNDAALHGGKDFTVAVRKQNTGIASIIKAHYPQVTLLRYATSQECIDAVKAGNADAYGNAAYEVEYNLQKPKNTELHIAYSYSCPIDYCIAMREDAPNELADILNKGVTLLSRSEAEQLIREYSSTVAYERTFADILYANRYTIGFTIALFVIIVVLWIYTYWLQHRAMTEIQKKSIETEKANEAKTQFLARMSHDMRTPMNGILGMAELSKGETDQTVLRHNIESMESAGQYMLCLINDMLDLQKLEAGKMKLSYEPTNSKEYVTELLDMMRVNAEEKGVTFVFENANINYEQTVLLDPLRLKQVFVNLISNAIKFTPKGGTVRFTSECLNKEKNMECDRFCVIDTGIGMSKEFLENGLFKPYSQEDGSATTKYGGTGLGLAISKNIIDAMGGSILVESTPGQGTCFTVILKFEIVKNKVEKCTAEASKQTDELQQLTGKRILLCEDHPLNAEIAKRLLLKAGCEVNHAVDGKLGVEAFCMSEIDEYQAILMDIRMPNMDGLMAAKAIRALERPDAKQIPIIAMTANAYEEDVKKSVEAGMNAHLAKPIDAKVLYQTLCRFL